MRTSPCLRPTPTAGFTMVLALIFTAITLLVLAAALSWCSTNSALTARNNQYFTTSAAAEAATEKVITSLSRDYQSAGEFLVSANLASYRSLVPTPAENGAWSKYAFNDASGNSAQTHVERLSTASYIPLQSQYSGLYGLASSFRIVSNARMVNEPYAIDAGVKQEVQLASIPLFQFAIFYAMDLEINPGPNMNVTGRVHGNSTIWMQPINTLTFQSHVTAGGQIFQTKSTNDPTVRSLVNSSVVFQGEHDANVASINLPIGTNNSPSAVRAIVDVPPDTELPTSLMGQQRYYNKADLVILVSNNTVLARSGSFNNFTTVIPPTEVNYFLKTNVTFYNKREGKTVKTTELDVGILKSWSGTNSNLKTALGHDVSSVYIADLRTQSGITESGVRIKNGQTLPSLGLTVATPNPLYVQGNYNAPSAFLGTTNTSTTLPASLVGDSINILSTAWNDANAGSGLSTRIAADTTVNAALLGGIVPSNGSSYSGGVENFPRFLEDWGGRKLAYNGSMVVMFYSQISTAPWGGSDVYSPPNRQWTFDLNFMDPAKLPPGTPAARALIRGQWALVKPNSTS